MKRAFILGINGSFFTLADELGGVRGFSLKNINTIRATTVPRIAWHRSELKMWFLACSLFSLSESELSTKKDGITNPTATPRGIDAVAIVVAIILYKSNIFETGNG